MTNDRPKVTGLPDPAKLVRKSIRVAMNMGMNEAEAQQVVFLVIRAVSGKANDLLWDEGLSAADVVAWTEALFGHIMFIRDQAEQK